MSAWELPTSLSISGVDWQIRTDFRTILDILQYFSNPNYESDEQWEICLRILYRDFEQMPAEQYQEAANKAIEFIDMGIADDGIKKPHTMDWEQDAPMIIPAVNRVMGVEVRALEYMHWWTFMGAYMEIGESVFSNIVSIRSKMARGKRLEKYEKEFYRENKALVDIKKRYTEAELKEKEALMKMLDGK